MWVTLAAMTLSNSMILVDQTAVPLATPDAIRDLGGNLSQSQWLLTANILPLAALMVLGGRLGDLLGLSVRRSRSPARSRACSSSAVRTA
jgi:MFS family permease